MNISRWLLESVDVSAWAAAVYGFVVGVAVTSAARKRRSDRQRADEFAKVAREIGFSLQSAVLPDSEEELKHLPLFARRRRRFSNVLLGYLDRGGEAMLFDFAFREGKQVVEQTVAAFRWPAGDLPFFQLGPNYSLAAPPDSFRLQDLALAHHPEFTRRYLLRGNDAAVRRFFPPEVAAFFENVDYGKEWAIEAAGKYLVVYRPGMITKTKDLAGMLNEASSVAALFHRAAAKSTFGR
jgi:hypothetical protein